MRLDERKLVYAAQIVLTTFGVGAGGSCVPKMTSQNLDVTPKPFS